jgi:hypothetical protein
VLEGVGVGAEVTGMGLVASVILLYIVPRSIYVENQDTSRKITVRERGDESLFHQDLYDLCPQ